MTTAILRRVVARAAVAAGISVGLALPAAAAALAAPGTDLSPRATLAADWLHGELGPDGLVPGFAPDFPDVGLSIDALFALRAGSAPRTQVDALWTAIQTRTTDFAGPYVSEWDPGAAPMRFGGASAKLLLAAEVAGADPRAVGPSGDVVDVLRQTLDLVSPEAGAGYGRGQVVDDVGTPTASNLFGQALAVMGLSVADLSGHDRDTTQRAVDYLLRQQCSAGWFPTFPTDKTCEQSRATGTAPDSDAAAMGVQALMAAQAAGYAVPDEAVARGLQFLLARQKPDGSYDGGTSTAGANTNSTGLVAGTLGAACLDEPAAAAGAWVARLQARSDTAGSGALRPDLGAVAYDPASWADGAANGIGDVRDPWRRATAQAVFALRPVALVELAGLELTCPVVTPSPTTGPTPRPTPSQPIPRPTSTDRPGGQADPRLSPATTPGGGRRLGALAPASGPVRGAAAPTVGSTSPTATTGGTGLPSPTGTAGTSEPAVATAAASRAASGRGLQLPPLVLALLGGGLLGGLVLLRPWQYLSRGTH